VAERRWRREAMSETGSHSQYMSVKIFIYVKSIAYYCKQQLSAMIMKLTSL